MSDRQEEIDRLARELQDEAEEAKPKPNGGTFRNANEERRKAESSRLADKYISRDGKPPVDDEVERLRELSDTDYEQERKAAASGLGVRVSVLDRFVAAAKTGKAESLKPEPEPWADPVAGDDLLDLIAETALDHVVLPDGAHDVIALWTVFAHVHDCFDISPLLAVTSPTPECGKTVLCDLLEGLVQRPLSACNMTPAVVFRAVEKWSPTLMIDEADSFLPDNHELRGIIDSGHRRSNAFVLRTVGDNHEPKQFTTWGPKVLALIGKLHPTLDSRSIHIRLRRMLATESVIQLRHDRRDHLVPIKRRLIRWAQDNAKALRSADPDMPNSLRGRAADNWRPLLAIADAVGGEWPERARQVAESFSGKSEVTLGIMLLEDSAAAFMEKQADRFSSKELCDVLTDREDRPWPEFKNGKPLSQRQLARLLEPFGIMPGTIRTTTGKTPKGYYLAAFEDAWKRYLSPDTPFPTATPPQPLDSKDFSSFSSATRDS
jgi:putative DNA primase/helicase